MNTLYLESSVISAWLLGEPLSSRIKNLLEVQDQVLTSSLSILETKRVLIRLEKMGKISPAIRKKIVGILEQSLKKWVIMEVDSEIIRTASDPFPVEPVRSLDAIHLATALKFLEAYPALQLASLDHRILANAEPLGIPTIRF